MAAEKYRFSIGETVQFT